MVSDGQTASNIRQLVEKHLHSPSSCVAFWHLASFGKVPVPPDRRLASRAYFNHNALSMTQRRGQTHTVSMNNRERECADQNKPRTGQV